MSQILECLRHILTPKSAKLRHLPDLRQKRVCYQSNVPPQTAMCLPPWSPWLTLLRTGGPEFVHCVKYRLGMPIYITQGNCPACQQPSDLMGDHALACPRYSDRIVRHNQLRDLLFETAASAALGPVREGRFLLPGTAAKPADILIPRWSDGKDGALDVTVTSPLCKTNVAGAAAEPGSALRSAYERKVQGAAAACKEQGLSFLPIAAFSTMRATMAECFFPL